MTDWYACKWDGKSGHYESWFTRANHPTRPLAFWVRHTIFAPAGNVAAAEGELWGVWFDGEKGTVTSGKLELPIRECLFANAGMNVRVGTAALNDRRLDGKLPKLAWSLKWTEGGGISLLFPDWAYGGRLPKAKALSLAPLARFTGTFEVDGEQHRIDDWPGSHNHNWGSQHTQRYAWVQVSGFDDAPEVFLECGSGRIKLGPVWTPPLSPMVVRIGSRRLTFNSTSQLLKTRAELGPFSLKLLAERAGVEVEVEAVGLPAAFVALRYRDPPGGANACLNTKLARCTMTLREQGRETRYVSANRAALELIANEDDPRVAKLGGFAA